MKEPTGPWDQSKKKEKLKDIKNQINELLSLEIQKKLLFLKQRYYEIGSKSTKLLAYKLKRHQTERVICKIRDPITKQVTPKLKEIQSCFEKYYKNLYSKKT